MKRRLSIRDTSAACIVLPAWETRLQQCDHRSSSDDAFWMIGSDIFDVSKCR